MMKPHALKILRLFLILEVAGQSSCQCDTQESGSCSSQLDCRACAVCLSGHCVSGIDLCDDILDNDCDGTTNEGCDTTCGGKECDSPPHRFCDDSNRVTYFAVPGVCIEGTCKYREVESICPQGCQNDACIGDSCIGITCSEDGNPCTDDGCDPVTGCTHTPNTAPCEDGDLCTGQDVCRGGMCVVGGGRDCDDGLACTSERCDPALGCVITPDDLACEDLDPCTDDRCDASAGCVFPLNAAACDDGDPCTMEDTCALGACTGVPRDLDHDGFVAFGCGGDDCNDNEEWINPDAEEVCDGYDNDCDGLTDILGTDLCHYTAICHRGAMTECPAGPGPTMVASVIDQDNVWCSTGSPFMLGQNTTILADSTVTIGPCLEVLASAGTVLRIRGGFSVNAKPLNPAVFRSDLANPQRNSWVGLFVENSEAATVSLRGAVIKHAQDGLHFFDGMVGIPVTLRGLRFETNGTGLSGYMAGTIDVQYVDFVDNDCGVEGGRSRLTDCTFTGNEKGLCRSEAYVADSIISGNMVGIEGYTASLHNCEITDNDIGVVPLEPYGGPELFQCDIQRNRIGILVSSDGMHSLNGSTLCGNTESDIRLTGPNDIDATNNWWCTTDPEEISSRIYDVYDDNALGRIVFEPFLTEEP